MRCPQCGHTNITAFEFCENCLAILPNTTWARPTRSRDPYDFDEERVLESLRATAPAAPEERDVSTFPWNPPNHRVDTLIGRDAELKAALANIEAISTQWSGRMMLVLGNRGTGTSTFVERVRERALNEQRDLVWAQAYCRDEPTRPYSVFGRLLRDYMKVPPQLDDWMAGERFLHEVRELFGEELEATATTLAQLVAFLGGFKIEGSPYLAPSDDEVQTLVPRASQALARLLAKMAYNQPSVFVLDEAHQATAPLLALLDLLVSGLPSAPVLLLLVGRPELSQAQPHWHTRAAVQLGPLPRGACEQILRRLLRYNKEDIEARLMLATLWRHLGHAQEAHKQLGRLERLEAASPWLDEITHEREQLKQALPEELPEEPTGA